LQIEALGCTRTLSAILVRIPGKIDRFQVNIQFQFPKKLTVTPVIYDRTNDFANQSVKTRPLQG